MNTLWTPARRSIAGLLLLAAACTSSQADADFEQCMEDARHTSDRIGTNFDADNMAAICENATRDGNYGDP